MLRNGKEVMQHLIETQKNIFRQGRYWLSNHSAAGNERGLAPLSVPNAVDYSEGSLSGLASILLLDQELKDKADPVNCREEPKQVRTHT